jgi:hypothetical protein
MERQESIPMFSNDLIRLMQEEREREIEANLRVRRLIGARRPFIHWRPRRRPTRGGPGVREL